MMKFNSGAPSNAAVHSRDPAAPALGLSEVRNPSLLLRIKARNSFLCSRVSRPVFTKSTEYKGGFMYSAQRISTFIHQEAIRGRNWLRYHASDSNDVYFSPNPGCTDPANAWPHLHLSYTYQDTLFYLGGKTSDLRRIDLYQNGNWNIHAITQFSASIQRAIISVQTFWTPPPRTY
ncbi:hypothetical protein Xedl_03778 [Xenorhabdus eapokensis]|uniref:Uncharacterized protein n=1 Tax=Xenorhabdus eapokensis TaxID=1873482 RepID=A0A1Q5TEZ5_9GAMM|nr:hypothetical protein Xedl_03778 [Xenorhabdus eapokensis]